MFSTWNFLVVLFYTCPEPALWSCSICCVSPPWSPCRPLPGPPVVPSLVPLSSPSTFFSSYVPQAASCCYGLVLLVPVSGNFVASGCSNTRNQAENSFASLVPYQLQPNLNYVINIYHVIVLLGLEIYIVSTSFYFYFIFHIQMIEYTATPFISILLTSALFYLIVSHSITLR